MNAVPGEFEVSESCSECAPRIAAGDVFIGELQFAECAGQCILEAECGGGEPGGAVLTGECGDAAGCRVVVGEWFVDEDRESGWKDAGGEFFVLSSIDGPEDDGVDLCKDFLDSRARSERPDFASLP
jgi:hypothetical protein